MRTIELTQGYTATVSDKDYSRVSQHKWFTKFDHKIYAACKIEGCMHRLHRFILGITSSKIQVDHKDGNGLNCQRRNIRIATGAQNQSNRKLNKNSKSGYKGVYWYNDRGKWRVQIQALGKKIDLGYFSSVKAAAKKYNNAAKKYFGRFALLNVVK